jgi:hypothetical protein
MSNLELQAGCLHHNSMLLPWIPAYSTCGNSISPKKEAHTPPPHRPVFQQRARQGWIRDSLAVYSQKTLLIAPFHTTKRDNRQRASRSKIRVRLSRA